MHKPIASQIINLRCVILGSSAIKKRQKIIDKIGMIGTKGVLKGRFKSGLCLLRTSIDADTMINAANVPIFTSSASSVMGNNAARVAAVIPTNNMPFIGVLNFLWSFEKNGGNNPSRDIAKNTLVCPKKPTKSTDVIPAKAPMDMIMFAQLIPIRCNANETGAAVSLNK